ncbi:MAG: DUF4465 domain-containing protein [Saprospiraceae bacterium]
MKKLFTILICALTMTLSAQTTADFENFNIGLDSALNGSDLSGGFTAGNLFMPNSYNPAWSAWNGWAISSMRDTTTPGYTNDLSAITGTGYNSSTYAVYYAFNNNKLHLQGDALGGQVTGFYITNATYTYLSLRDGDGFAKKFGGATGDDPDYLLLTIQKYKDGVLGTESVEFYLADYRFSDNTQDYIVDDWQYIDLTSLGDVDSLSFVLSSTDVGASGMNTPAYFCMDDFTTADVSVSTNSLNQTVFKVFPNPTTDFIQIDGIETVNARYSIIDYNGRVIENQALNLNQVPVYHLPKGMYVLLIETEKGSVRRSFVKQ